jgi:hypothetical protein
MGLKNFNNQHTGEAWLGFIIAAFAVFMFSSGGLLKI